MKKLIFIAVALAAVSCVRIDIDEILLKRDDISLTVRGVTQFEYKAEDCQMAHKPSENEYRVYNDDLSKWFVVRCSERPSNSGQILTAELTYKTVSKPKSQKDLSFKVEKIDETGKIWMWCENKNIGIVIKNL